MKTVTSEEKKSLFSKLIEKIKNSALVAMFLNPDYGAVTSSDSEKQLENLANSTGISENELHRIEKEFNNAHSEINGLVKEVSTIPDTLNDDNPFRVSENDLNADQPKTKTPKEKNKIDRERDDTL